VAECQLLVSTLLPTCVSSVAVSGLHVPVGKVYRQMLFFGSNQLVGHPCTSYMQAWLKAIAAGCSCSAIFNLLKDADQAAVVLLVLRALLLQMKPRLGGPARMCRASPAQPGPANHSSLLRPAESAAVPSMA